MKKGALGFRLVFTGELPESKDGHKEGIALKITRLGIKQEDAVLNIDLDHPNKPGPNSADTQIMAAVQEYYSTFGCALKSNDLAVLAQNTAISDRRAKTGTG